MTPLCVDSWGHIFRKRTRDASSDASTSDHAGATDGADAGKNGALLDVSNLVAGGGQNNLNDVRRVG